MAASPSPLSTPIMVGNESRSPYQWAAKLAPEGKVTPYKDAMLWLEGEYFGSTDEFLAKVLKIIEFQEDENHHATATVEVPVQPASPPADESTADQGWKIVAAPVKARKPPIAKLTRQQLAKAIVDGCLRELHRIFSYTGPSMDISSVYPRFSSGEFTYPQLIGAIRDEIQKLRVPSEEGFPVPKSARYSAASSAGKVNNFNFKVQKKDATKSGGWSAVAQIHVLWQ